MKTKKIIITHVVSMSRDVILEVPEHCETSDIIDLIHQNGELYESFQGDKPSSFDYGMDEEEYLVSPTDEHDILTEGFEEPEIREEINSFMAEKDSTAATKDQ